MSGVAGALLGPAGVGLCPPRIAAPCFTVCASQSDRGIVPSAASAALTDSAGWWCVLVRLCRYKVPTLVVGGGGYTLRNVARCWCYETGRLMGHDLPDKLPESVLNSFNYYMDNERLRIEVGG